MVTQPEALDNGYSLVGFIGDIRGDEWSLMTHHPVVRHGEVLYVAIRQDWSGPDDLKPLSPDDPYVHIPVLFDKEPPPIMPGEVVWLAGRVMVSRCDEIARYSNRFRYWTPIIRDGFVYKTGTRTEFREFSTHLLHATIGSLAEALRHHEDFRSTHIESIFEVLNNLHDLDDIADMKSRAVWRGVYYLERPDPVRMEYIISDAVLQDLFKSKSAFTQKVVKTQAKWRNENPVDSTSPVAVSQRRVMPRWRDDDHGRSTGMDDPAALRELLFSWAAVTEDRVTEDFGIHLALMLFTLTTSRSTRFAGSQPAHEPQLAGAETLDSLPLKRSHIQSDARPALEPKKQEVDDHG